MSGLIPSKKPGNLLRNLARAASEISRSLAVQTPTLQSAGFTSCFLRPSSIAYAMSGSRVDQVQSAKLGAEGPMGVWLAKASRR